MRDRKEDNLRRKQLWLEQCAWANRRAMTPSELRLWSALSARELGVQFRREMPLAGHYIVDFCATSARLVVEVDGECHAERRRADARRDAALNALGYRVLRISAHSVMQDLPAAVALVRAALCGFAVATLIRVAPACVIAAVNFDDQPNARSGEVHDEAAPSGTSARNCTQS